MRAGPPRRAGRVRGGHDAAWDRHRANPPLADTEVKAIAAVLDELGLGRSA
jgi:hypothetical protein